jgi:hypothetical protein
VGVLVPRLLADAREPAAAANNVKEAHDQDR